MRIIVDTNVVFSAILNPKSSISNILLKPKSKLNFYSTNQILIELDKHKGKIKKLGNYTESEFENLKIILISKIRFINIELIPVKIYENALKISSKVDIDDTEFVALTDHIKGKLWTGDKKLANGLLKNNWNKIITTIDLKALI